MNLAFYAPMKPPDHPSPSGDRRMARLLREALRRAGHRAELISRFRSYGGSGDAEAQRRLARRGETLARRLVARLRARPAADRPRLWFTYHLYHKAPDWLGPTVAAALRIPYVVAEASHADKQADGPWAFGLRAAARAISAADAIICLNAADAPGVRSLLKSGAHLCRLAPFLDPRPYGMAAAARDDHRRRLAAHLALPDGEPWLMAVAMMRDGDKLRSYRVLGEALARLMDRPWRLVVVGDGAARGAVEAALAVLAERVRWLGVLDADSLAPLYAAADLCVWPAINEAYGMALLEAQAAGLPVVAGRVGGVPDIVADGETGVLVPVDDFRMFAEAVARLLDDAPLRRGLGAAAIRKVATAHDIASAARMLDALIAELAG